MEADNAKPKCQNCDVECELTQFEPKNLTGMDRRTNPIFGYRYECPKCNRRVNASWDTDHMPDAERDLANLFGRNVNKRRNPR